MISKRPFKLRDWLVEPDLNQLSRADRIAKIEPRYMDLLVYLADRQGELVSADEIHRHVWAGMVVGDHSVYQAVARLRKALGDSPGRADYIETVSKRGYRLLVPAVDADDHPVNAGLPEHPGSSGTVRDASASLKGHPLTRRAVLLLMVFITALLVWKFSQNPAPPTHPDTPKSVAVLPFTSMESDSRDGLLAHGMSIELLTHLGSIDGLNVVGYVSSALVSGEGVGYREAGELLGADLLILGKLRRINRQLLVYVEMVESSSGQQMWSRRFDQQSGDIFVLEAEIADQVAQALGKVYTRIEAQYKSAPSSSLLEAYDYYLLGRHYQAQRAENSLVKALEMYRKSIETDPGLASGYRGVAAATLLLSYYSDQPLNQAVELALANLEQALELDPGDEEVYATFGLARHLLGEYAVADQYFDRALSINRNYASAWMWKGIGLEKQGRLREALIHFRRAAAIEPLSIVVAVNLAQALQASGELDAAMELLQRVAGQARSSPQYLRIVSSLLLNSGDLVNAYLMVEQALELGAGDRLSIAQKALVLQLLGQTGEARELVRSIYRKRVLDSAGTSAVDEIIISSDLDQRTNAARAIDNVLRQEHQLPAIVWRRYAALLGLIDAFAGEYSAAVKRLSAVLTPGTESINRTDFDLIYCNALTLSLRESGAMEQSRDQQIICKNALKFALDQGWNSHWIAYAEAQLALLDGDAETAIGRLQDLEKAGFVRMRMLQNDPLFIGVRQNPEIRGLLERMQKRLSEAWLDIDSKRGDE